MDAEEIYDVSDYAKLAEWKQTIDRLIEQYGENAILSAGAEYVGVEWTIEREPANPAD